eukprot:CAMPEP_0175009724 /NCGR_PEP_ID=MMETSP0005-20121125/7710_1 /TAXON_ID=420556 /ORGANISM="Ochromonas sp., Strain CCMP1393" /LENGTH=916 /DNA_ID=CAMNT_0016265477 /DNA_START=11 /DNA_END=2761 /DNA_ORIENTATION=-
MIDSHEPPLINNAMGLQSLLDEPQRLATEAERLNIELEALVMDNYKVFVENLTCSVHLRLEDKKLGEISSDLEANLSDLSQKCLVFKDKVSHFVGSHKRNRKTLQHHMQLVELLEVPQLVDACARSGFHDEALELANFVNGLERRHLLASEVKSLNGKLRGGSGVIQSIVDDVHHILGGLRTQLLQQLTESSTLPKEISILATLRKLDGLLIDRHLALERHEVDSNSATSSNEDGASSRASQQQHYYQLRHQLVQNSEIRLQMDFLELRTVWLMNTCNAALVSNAAGRGPPSASSSSGGGGGEEASGQQGGSALNPAANLSSSTSQQQQQHQQQQQLGPYGRVMQMLEVRRTAWYTVITQFNALFEETAVGQGQLQGGITNTTTTPVKGLDSSGDLHSTTAIAISSFSPAITLNTWTTHQISELLQELQVLLPAIDDGASLRSVFEQILFFASRMSQVGCDFSSLILPLFQEVMLDRVQNELHKAVENFKIMVLTERISFNPNNSSNPGGGVAGLTASIFAIGNSNNMNVGNNSEQLIPLYAAQDTNANATMVSAPTPTAAAAAGGGIDGEVSDLLKPAATPGTSGAAPLDIPSPQLLLRFPPLAYVLNSLLTAMNYLRECPLITTEQPAMKILFDHFHEIAVYLVEKAEDLRKIGKKYFSEGFLRELGSYKSTTEKKNAAAERSSSSGGGDANRMDRLYAQVLALEMVPHVMVCFDSIYSANRVKLEARCKIMAARNMKRFSAHSSSSSGSGASAVTGATGATGGGGRELICLVKDLFEATDLLDSDVVRSMARLWRPLVRGQLLDAAVMNREYIAPAQVAAAFSSSSASGTAAAAAAAAGGGGGGGGSGGSAAGTGEGRVLEQADDDSTAATTTTMANADAVPSAAVTNPVMSEGERDGGGVGSQEESINKKKD